MCDGLLSACPPFSLIFVKRIDMKDLGVDYIFQTHLIHRDLKITRVKQNLAWSSMGSMHSHVNKIK